MAAISLRRFRPVFLAVFATLAALWSPGSGWAKIPAPDYILYGLVSSGGQTVENGTVTALIGDDQIPVASYEVGPAAAGQYVLRVPMDSVDPRTAGTAREGDVAQIYVSNQFAGTVIIGVPGTHRATNLDVDFLNLDLDGDGLTGAEEQELGTDPTVADTDQDGMPDGFEVANGFDPLDASDGAQDDDGDGLSNAQEAQFGLDALTADAPLAFRPGASLADAVAPQVMLLSDLNRDGILDLVVADADPDPDQIFVYLGDGMGGFTLSETVGTGGSVASLMAGDMNSDGHEDLIVTENSATLPGGVAVFLNGGTGTFSAPLLYDAGTDPACSSVGDLDADGWLDLVVTNAGSDDVSVLLHDGISGLSLTDVLPVGWAPRAAVLEDLDGDGVLDLLVANGDSDDLSLLRGQGGGGFLFAASLPAGTSPISLSLGDFDGDLSWDVVVANEDSQDFSVLLGDSAGSFQGQTRFETGGVPTTVLMADFDDDGFQDLAVLTRDPDQLLLLLGDGNGGFKAAVALGLDGAPVAMAAGDVDQDGLLDFVVAGEWEGSVTVFRTAEAGISGGGGGGGGCVIRTLTE